MKDNKTAHNHQHASNQNHVGSHGYGFLENCQLLKKKMKEEDKCIKKGLKCLIKALLCCVSKHVPDDMDIQKELDDSLKSSASTNSLNP